jgi:DNA-binding NtrC family response regulator
MDALDQILIGSSPSMQRLKRAVRMFGRSDLPVLVHGPTGSGKELVATALHLASGRPGSLIAINICAVADSMVEATLFGHDRGAFTGAVGSATGLLREADEGTLFLDEVGGIPIATQMKLLRVLETRTFRPVGGRTDTSSNFRLVAATNDDVRHMTSDGRFRQDLLQRLCGAALEVPSLLERLEDLPALCRHLLTRQFGSEAPALEASALRRLAEHHWPGNVRELANVLQRAVLYAYDAAVTASHITSALGQERSPRQYRHPGVIGETLRACEESGWDVAAAAEELGVHKTTVYRRLARAGVYPGSSTAPLPGDARPSAQLMGPVDV